jgi:gliding motility-associated-like protein
MANTYNWVNDQPGIGLPASGTGNIPAFASINAGNTPVTAHVTVTPSIVDLAYVANSEEATVSVINTSNNTVITKIPVGAGPNGVAVSPDNKTVYTANATDNTVSVISTTTNTVTFTIHVGLSPTGVIVSADGSRLYVTNGTSNSILVINTVDNTVIRPIIVGFTPYGGMAFSPDGSTLYESNFNANDVLVINTATNLVTALIPVGDGPVGLAMSPDGSLLYVADQDESSLDIINTSTNAVIKTIPTGLQPTAMVLSADGTKLYLTNSNSNNVWVINTADYSTITTIDAGQLPFGISMTGDGSYIYVSNKNSNDVSVISTATNTVVSTIKAGKAPYSIGNFITSFVSCAGAPTPFNINVNPNLVTTILPGPVSGSITSCAGSPSASPQVQQFTVSGINLTGSITATAPQNFEVSLNPTGGFAKNVALPQTGGKVDATPVYVRSSAAAPAGDLSGNVMLSSPGAQNISVAVIGSVYALPTANKISNFTYNNGDQATAIPIAGTGGSYTWTNDASGIGLAAGGTGNIASFTAVNTGQVPVTATVTVIPHPSGYAYVENGNPTQSSPQTISVINTSTNKITATILVGIDPLAITTSPDKTRIYATNSGDGTVSVISTATNKVLSTIKIAESPLGIAITPDGKKLYITYGSALDIYTVVDLTTNKTTNIKADYFYYGVVVGPDGLVYMANDIYGTILIISSATDQVVNEFSAGPAIYGLAMSPDGRTLYATNPDQGTTSVVNMATYAITTVIPVGKMPNGIAISPDGSKVYVSNFDSNNVSVISTASNAVTATVDVGITPFGIFVTPDNSKVYVCDAGGSSVSVIDAATNKVTATVTVGTSPESFGQFIIGPLSCDGPPMMFTITVNPPTPPIITEAGTLTGLSTIYGTASPSENFKVSAKNVTRGILVTPPQGFEVSTDNKTFSAAVTLGTSGSITATVYIRLAATTVVGLYSGNVVLGDPGPAEVDVNMPQSDVERAQLTVIAPDVIRVYGAPNPVFIPNYVGFVNGENQSVLTTLPELTTIATINSAEGKYAIHVSGGSTPNYVINPVDGTLTIVASASEIIIPNAFTPNGDGINDIWNIKKLDDFPQCLVSVYSRYGSLVFQSHGYAKPWDGTSNGSPVPTGTYYYIINTNLGGFPPLSGYVAVLR